MDMICSVLYSCGYLYIQGECLCDVGCEFLTGLRSGHLLLSIKSRCRCFGKETIDWTEVPEDLIAHGIQVRSACFNAPGQRKRSYAWVYLFCIYLCWPPTCASIVCQSGLLQRLL